MNEVVIASFFRNIGLADTLGSGTRKLFKYSKYYSGLNPEFREGDVFQIIVPLDDTYSFDYNLEKADSGNSSVTIDGSSANAVGRNCASANPELDSKMELKIRNNPELLD